MSLQPPLPPPPPPPPPPPTPCHQSLGSSTIRPKPNLKNPYRKPSQVQKVRFAGLDNSSGASPNLQENNKYRMKKSHAHAKKHVVDVNLPPPTLSSGEGEEIPLDGESLGAVGGCLETPNSVELPTVGAVGAVGDVGGSAVSSNLGVGPATSTPWNLQPKNLKNRLDNFFSPPPRFMRPDGRLFSPRGFVGLSNENEVPRSSPPPGRFFVAFAILLVLVGVALLVAVVVHNTRNLDRLFQKLEENKHTIAPADVNNPIIEPLPPSAVRYVGWPLSRQNDVPLRESSEEQTDHDDKIDEAQVSKKHPLGKVAFPDVKLFLEPKYLANESNPVNAVLTGTFGSINGTFDLTKIGDVIHAHMRKKRQVPISFVNRMLLNNLNTLRDELGEQNALIDLAMKAFNVKVKDVSPTKIDLPGMSLREVADFGRSLLKNRESLRKKNEVKAYINSILEKKKQGLKPADGALETLVDKRQKNAHLISEINTVVEVIESGSGKLPEEDPKTNEITPDQTPSYQDGMPSTPSETPLTPAGTPLAPAETPSTPAETPSTPADTSATPADTSATPADTSATPAETSATPAETSATPAETSATPAETSATPAETSATPAETSATPAETSATPAKTSATPAETSATPAETSATPAETSATPYRTPSTPAETSATPSGMLSTPAETLSTPAKMPSTPSGTPGAPAGIPPTLAGTPPTLAGTPPTLAGTPPTLAGTPPTLAGTPPTLAGTPPTLAGTPPTLAGRPPTPSGTPPTPSGTPPTPSGTPPTPSGTPPTPAGTPRTLAGTPPTLAGTPPSPAGILSLLSSAPRRAPSTESTSWYGTETSTTNAVAPKNILEKKLSNTANILNGSEVIKMSIHSANPDGERNTVGLGDMHHSVTTPVTPTVNPSITPALNSVTPEKSSSHSKASNLPPTLEKDIALVHMGRVKGGNTTISWIPHSEVDLSSLDRSGKKAVLEKVELQENLQSMENATNGSARRGTQCDHDHRSCASGGVCIHKLLWCDEKVNCPDSSDEIYCSCRDRVDKDRLCDGYFDCPNGEDELGCLDCESDEFDCGDFDERGTGICAAMATRCDGRRQCPSGKDEQSCSFLSDGILVGVPGQLAAVSMSQGVLHHNWRGHWLPVCWAEADIEWATAVCQEVVSRNVTRYDVELRRVRIPPKKYFGKWISLSNGVSEQEDCEFASYVTCPKIEPGTRVPPTTDPNESHWNTPSSSGTHFMDLLESFKKKVKQLETLVVNEAAAEGVDVNQVAGPTIDELQDVENLLESFPPSSYDHDGEVVRPQRMVGERVIGGTPSRPGAWPWVVALYRDGKFFCGGALLNEYWVLTAAHCVQDADSHFMEVQAGMLRRSTFSPTEQIVTVDKVVTNRKFNMEFIQNDIALVHVSPAFILNRWVRPILLPSTKAELDDIHKLHITDPGNGHKCTVVGWGSTAEYGPAADNESEVKVPVDDCKSKIDRLGNDICAGEPEGGRDACQGDSGGPLLCSVPERPSLWFAAGIVSHGEGCGRPNKPGAYTRVSDYVDWIYQVMNEDSDTELTTVRYPYQSCPGFHCESGTKRCIPKAKRCDRSVDCLHADDEEECPWDMDRSFSLAKNTSNPLNGYAAFIPTTINEPVETKAFHENTLVSTGTGTKVDEVATNSVINNVHDIVAAVSATTTAAPYSTATLKPYSSTAMKPQVITSEPEKPVLKPASFPLPVDTVNPEAEKGVTPAPLGEPLAPPPTEQVNPPPDFPTDSQNLIHAGSDGRNHTAAASATVAQESESSSSSSETSSESSETGDSGEKSSEESVEETDATKLTEKPIKPEPVKPTVKPEYPPKPVKPTEKPEHPRKKPKPVKPTEKPEHPPKKPKPVKEPPAPIPVIPAPTDPVPETTVSPPFIADFDPNKDFLCANARQKIIKERYCDGVADCMDNSDETNCTCRDKLLALSPQAICDGLTDCYDGTDEEGCSLCPTGQIRCGLSIPPKCISQSAECDGVEDCPRGEDEEHCLALTDGTTVILDRIGIPVVRSEGIIARKKRGVWKAVCGLSKADRTATAWAFDACKDMGYNDWQSFNESSVADTNLAVAFEVVTPLVGPVSPSPAPPSPPPPNVLASHCSAINVRCSPNVDGNTDRFLVAERVHEWPWFSELLVDGVSTCTGVLVNPNWVVTSYQCFKAVGFDIQKNMLTALMGGSRSELGILEPNEQIRRADDIRLIPNTDILMVHLSVAFIETRHVRPTGLPDWFSMARKALTCVAVGRGLQGSWESLILQHEVTCSSEGLGKTCFTPLVPNAGCTNNVTTAPWSGALVCRARTGWYPAAVYHEPYGRCGLAGLQAYDGLLYSLRSIRSLIDGPLVGSVDEPMCAGLRCPEGTCLPSHAACDGVPQCRDASDENPILCASLKEKCSPSNGLGCVCSPNEAQCGGGHGCIPLTSWCDGRPDCTDGSDEGTACGCADLLRATRPHLLCDGRRHCDDHSDEDPAMCGCVADRFLCSRSGHCVSTDTVCDGLKDCPYGEDEAQCFSVRPFDAPSVSYNAFGEVVRRSHGLWHDMCAPPDPESQLNGATAACAAIGMTLLAYDVAPRATDPTIAPLLLVDSSSGFVLTNRTVITLRGDRPLAQISEGTVRPEKCLALRVTCK